jgi:hypothetical protein
MQRLLLITLALALAAAPARAATPTPADKVTLSARISACTTGVDPAERAATFTGAMPTMTGARTMQIRFVLLQRRGSAGTFQAIDVPDWGTWETSGPGRPGFVFTKRIDALLAPAGYKAAVYFRWLDRKGHVLRMLRRTTTACEQPDPRPELVFAALSGTATAGGASYAIAVRNDGRSTAPPFTVTVAFDGVTQGSVSLGTAVPDATVQGTMDAPRCKAGSTVTVTVDATDAVDETDETDNVVQRPCPVT